MKFLLSALLLCSASLAFAHCPNAVVCEMKAIDSSVGVVKLADADLEKVKTLRAEGEKLYNDGREGEALKLLRQARKMLKDAAT
jgi:hypothetical protein